MAVSTTILDHIEASLRGLSAKEAAPRIKALAVHYGVTTATINRWASQRGIRFRKERSNKGQSKATRDVCMGVSTLQWTSRRVSNKIPLPACDAMQMLEDSGRETGGVSIPWMRARLRQERLSAKHLTAPSPHVRLLSDHPNHVCQFDVTNCLQYFLDTKKGMGERDTEMTMYANKVVETVKTIKKQLLRYVFVDHCSGAFYMEYFYASGERAADGADFLYRAMRPKDELIKKTWPDSCPGTRTDLSGDTFRSPVELPKHVPLPVHVPSKLGKYRFHGVPFILVADRGSIVSAKANQALFDYLRIKLEPHMPGNPRAKGAVEGMMKYINRFEARLKFQRPADLEELNRWALDWCIYVNAVCKMRGSAPRSIQWSSITAAQLRLCPDYAQYHLGIKEPTITRTAGGDRIISVDGLSYQVPDSQAAKQVVSVVRHPYEFPKVEVHFNGYVWLCDPIPRDQYNRLTNGVRYGEYKSPRHTETQKAKTEMEKKAEELGITWKGTGDKRMAVAPPVGFTSPLTVFGHQADKVGNIEFIERKGTPLAVKQPEAPENQAITSSAAEVSRSIAARRISFYTFLKQLSAEIGIVEPPLHETLRVKYENGIEINEAEEVISKIAEGTWHGQEPGHAVEAVG